MGQRDDSCPFPIKVKNQYGRYSLTTPSSGKNTFDCNFDDIKGISVEDSWDGPSIYLTLRDFIPGSSIFLMENADFSDFDIESSSSGDEIKSMLSLLKVVPEYKLDKYFERKEGFPFYISRSKNNDHIDFVLCFLDGPDNGGLLYVRDSKYPLMVDECIDLKVVNDRSATIELIAEGKRMKFPIEMAMRRPMSKEY